MSKKNQKNLIVPKPGEVAALVDEACQLKREIETRQKRLKEIEERLELFALNSPHEPLKDAKREGRQVIARGASKLLPIQFTSDAIITGFRNASEKHYELEDILRGIQGVNQLDLFFAAPSKWENRFRDGQRFREEALKTLGHEVGEKFILACRAVDKDGIPKSTTRFAYDDAEDIGAPAA